MKIKQIYYSSETKFEQDFNFLVHVHDASILSTGLCEYYDKLVIEDEVCGIYFHGK
jgi:ketosteroid isomerase-like protein